MKLNSNHRLILDSYFEALPTDQWPQELVSAVVSLGFEDHCPSDDLLSAAVARLVLASVQDGLPDHEIVKLGSPEDIDVWTGEKIPETPPKTVGLARDEIRQLSLDRSYFKPQHVLTLNIATGGFGYTWPESYYVTKVDYCNKYVVTVSLDIGDDGQFIDTAIAHFPTSDELNKSIETALTDRWRTWFDADADRWEDVTRDGLMTSDRAYEIQDLIWGAEEDDKLE